MKADIWGQSLPTCFLVQPFLSLLFPGGQLHAVQLSSLHVHRCFTSGLHRICSQLKFSRKFCLKNETTHLRILSVPEKNKTKQIKSCRSYFHQEIMRICHDKKFEGRYFGSGVYNPNGRSCTDQNVEVYFRNRFILTTYYVQHKK